MARTLLGEGARYPQRDVYLGLLVTAAAGAVASFYFHARGQAASLQAAKAAAERDATEAHLRLLQSQLEPHMLFNTLANLRALIAAGISSFKIEGRLKDLSYVKNITAHYRLLLDAIIDEQSADLPALRSTR